VGRPRCHYPAGGFDELEVEFVPDSSGRLTGVLFLTSNRPESPHRVDLAGLGLGVRTGQPPVQPS
jgi:hypothetical protein